MTIDLSICLCTFKRPVLLDQLLLALSQQDRAGLSVEIIIVDNDPLASAQPVFARWQDKLGIPATLLHETTPNISMARNRAFHAASGTYILWIDDDETPAAGWINNMFTTLRDFEADAVFGPVLPRYTQDTPDWIREGGYFERRRFPTGTRIGRQDARTGNVLMHRETVAAIPGPFDTSFGRTGAEDTVLFNQLLAQGARFIWCDEASVSEEVPQERATLSWLLKRSYRLGQTYILSEILVIHGLDRFLRASYLVLRATVQLGLSVCLALLFAPVSRTKSVRWLRVATSQCGKLSTLLGHRYHEYGN